MNRGEVWGVNSAPASGGESTEKRVALIISNDAANRHLNHVQVVPLTSSTSKLYPSEAYVLLEAQQHKALADQLTMVSKQRLSGLIVRLSEEDVQKVERVIRLQLGL